MSTITDEQWVQQLAARIVVDVCELERDSPEDDPMACVVYAPELTHIVERRVSEALQSLRSPSPAPEASDVVAKLQKIIDDFHIDMQVELANAEETGERPDLWPEEIDTPVRLLVEAAEALSSAQARERELVEKVDALMRERTSLIETKREQIERLTADRDAANYELAIRNGAEWEELASRAEAAERENKALRKALDEIRELNLENEDENGHRWANSDMIDQTVIAAISSMKGKSHE